MNNILLDNINTFFPKREAEIITQSIIKNNVSINPNNTEYQTYLRARRKLILANQLLMNTEIQNLLKDRRFR